MQEKSVTPTEMTFTAMARIAAGEGDGARAESLVRMYHACFDVPVAIDHHPCTQIADMRARGLTPKLRTYNPALQCYCDAGDIKRVCTHAVCCTCAFSCVNLTLCRPGTTGRGA